MRFRCVSMRWINWCNADAHQIRIRYAYAMRIQNSKRMRISECVFYTHYMHIQDTVIPMNIYAHLKPHKTVSFETLNVHQWCVTNAFSNGHKMGYEWDAYLNRMWCTFDMFSVMRICICETCFEMRIVVHMMHILLHISKMH